MVCPRPTGTLLAACLTLVTALSGTLATGALATGAHAEARNGATVRLHGRLLVVASERPGGPTAYGVALGDGDIVPVRGRLGADARTGDVFTGRVVIPLSVRRSLAGRAGSGPAAALREVDRRRLTLALAGTPSVAHAAAAPTPTAHQQFVAALDNKGSLGQDDAQLLAHVSSVGGYWQGESNGAIAQIDVPSTVLHYDTALATTDCGTGQDFFDVVQEAAAEFPGFDFGGPDQLVVFVPPSCQTGSIVGEGTVGSSFASGGALVVKAGDSIEGTYAHETGHNYGFEHANARYSGTSMEYFGVYDVMGFALPSQYNQLTALSTPYRVFQGITDPGEIQKVRLGRGKEPVRVSATIEPRSADSGVRSVRVADPDTGERLYLDFRSGTGEDDGAFYDGGHSLGSPKGTVTYAPGVVVTAARDGSGVDALVVDSAGDTSLAAGKTWKNASGSLRIRVTRLGGAAHVKVSYQPPTRLIRPAPRPHLRGTPHVGVVVTAHPGTWMHGVRLHFHWLVGGSVVAGATGRHYTPRRADRGQRIRVEVTGTKPGYRPVTKRSAATVPVASRGDRRSA
jgi:hypothetical protein